MKLVWSLLLVSLCLLSGARAEAGDGEGCADVPFSICLGELPDPTGKTATKGMSIVAGDATPKGLVGYWSFDDSIASDSSRNGNHFEKVPTAGPGFITGTSAYFAKSEQGTIKHIPAYQSKDLTVAFWIFLEEQVVDSFPTVFHKGSEKNPHPSINLWEGTQRVHVRVGRNVMDSISSIPVGRWTHVAYVQSIPLIQLFINGNLDASKVLLESTSDDVLTDDEVMDPAGQEEPIYLTKDPWHPGVAALVDELRIYNRALPGTIIAGIGAAAYPGMPGGGAFTHLGCPRCGFTQANSACKMNYHLCTKLELASSALLFARTQGWVNLAQNPKIWYGEEHVPDKVPSGDGVGICCHDTNVFGPYPSP